MIIDCRTDRCHCSQSLFKVEGFTGTVEVKCPRCKRVHTFDYGGASDATSDVRCNGSFRGEGFGGWCGQLIARISPDSSGEFGYRCKSCRESKTIRIQTPIFL